MENKKIAIRILLILIFILCILLPTKVSAMSQEEAGVCIAKYAINFARQNGSRTQYYNYDAAKRYYSVMTGQPNPDTNTYVLECSSFASMVLKQSIGLTSPDGAVENNNGRSMFWDSLHGAYPTSEHYYPELFDIVQGDLKQGDILVNDHHVMVYVGNNSIVHCDGRGAGIGQGAISFESIDSYNATGHSDGCSYYAFRLKATVAEGLSEGNIGGGDFDWPDLGGVVDSIKGFFGELIGEDEEFPIGTPLSDEEYNNLYYKGIATLKGSSTTEQEPDEWVFPSLADITDWISGFLIMPVRAAITGWANIVQIVVSEYINAAAGGEVSGITEIMTNMSEYMKNAITLEKIVYNEVPLFDVNVFAGENAGGETVDEDTLVATIRTLVANWYYVFRLIAIIGLLIILIYIGIKMAISTVAEEKAKYKSLFVNWLVAFVIVFFMQYFMIFVMQINQALIDIFKEIGKSLNLYETVRSLTWEVKMTTGIIATALYVMLVYYMIKFVIMYFKRLFIVVILIILAPLIAAKYAIDKLSGNKDSQSLKVWGQEYVFNVLMQSIHALTYTIFTAVSVDIAKATTNTTSDVSYLFANVILVIVFFRFMIESEKILKQMMKLVTGPGADFGDANSTSIRDLFGLTIFSQIMREMKPFYRVFRFMGRKVTRNTRVVRNIKRPFRQFSNYIQDSYVLYNTERYKNRLRNMDNINLDIGNTYGNADSDIIGIGGQVDKVLRQDLINRKELLKDYIGTDFNIILGMGKTFVGLPIFLAESPLVGAELMLVGLRTVRVAIGKPITGYRKPEKMTNKWYKSPVVRGTYKTMTAIMTGGTVNIAHKVYERYKNENELRDMELSQVELLLKAQNLEASMSGNLTVLKNKYFKGYGKDANLIGNNLAQINEKELIQNIRDSQLSIPQDEIYNEVKEYKNQTGRYTLNNDDMNNIINNIRNRENKKLEAGEDGVKLTNKFNNNMKAELVSGIVNNVKGENSDYSSLKLSQESLEIMSNNLKSRIEQLEDKEIKTEQELEETNTLKLAYYMIKQKQVENIDKNEINELDAMTNNMQTIIKESEENSKEDEIRTVVYNVLNERKQKLETDMSKLGEEFTKTEEDPIKQPEESKNDLKQVRQKLEKRLDELNKQEDLDEKGLQEKEATQRAYNIVQDNIAINESNKEIEKNTREIAEEILNDYRNENELGENTQQTILNEEKGPRNVQETVVNNIAGSQNVQETVTTGIDNKENVQEPVKDTVSGVVIQETIQTKAQEIAEEMRSNTEKEEPRSIREMAEQTANDTERGEVRSAREIAEQMTNDTERGETRSAREIAEQMTNDTERGETRSAREIAEQMVNNTERGETRSAREIAEQMINNTERGETKSAREIAEQMINNTEKGEVKNAREIAEEMTNNTEREEASNPRATSQKATYNNINENNGNEEEFNSKIEDIKKNKIEDIVNSIEKGEKNTVFSYELEKKDEYKVNKAIIDSMSESVLENELSKLSDKDLGRLIKKSTKIEGSIEKNKVSDKYKDIVRNAEKLRDINEESEEKYGKRIFSTKELIEGIRKGIRGKEKNRNDEEE